MLPASSLALLQKYREKRAGAASFQAFTRMPGAFPHYFSRGVSFRALSRPCRPGCALSAASMQMPPDVSAPGQLFSGLTDSRASSSTLVFHSEGEWLCR